MITFLANARFLRVYHWTDTRNLASIRAHGLLSLRELTARGMRPLAPGGNAVSHQLDINSPHALDSYVHLCLTDDHPMAYRAKQNGHVVDTRYISVNKQVLARNGVMFCNDVANKNGVVPMPIADATAGPDLPFWGRWNDFSDKEVQQQLKRAKRFEVLVPTSIEAAFLGGL